MAKEENRSRLSKRKIWFLEIGSSQHDETENVIKTGSILKKIGEIL